MFVTASVIVHVYFVCNVSDVYVTSINCPHINITYLRGLQHNVQVPYTYHCQEQLVYDLYTIMPFIKTQHDLCRSFIVKGQTRKITVY